MSVLSTIVDLATSGGFGVVTGLIGGVLSKWHNYKMAKLQFEHDQYMGELDMKRDQMQFDHTVALADKRIEQSQIEGEIASDVRAADAFIESQRNSQTTGWGVQVWEFVKSLIRPVLTGVLIWFAYDIYTDLHDIVGGLENLDPVKAQDLFVYSVHAVFFLTITAVAWWFASRGDKAVKAIKGMIG